MTCTLCDLPTPDSPYTDDEVNGEFCCHGCLEVSRVLDDPAETDPTTVREELEAATESSDSPTGSGQGGETAYLRVEGMHCTTCEAFLESVALRSDGIMDAEANYPSGLLKLTYDLETIESDDLPAVVSGVGYRAGLADEPPENDYEAVGRLLVGGFFGMMTMLWYILFLYPVYLGVPADQLLLDSNSTAGTYLLLNLWVMTTVVLGYTGYPLLRGAYVSLRAGRPNMDLLVTLAAGTAYTYSVLAMLVGHAHVYFDVSVVVVMAVSLGGYYEHRIRERATSNLADVAAERIEYAERRVRNSSASGTETVPVEDVRPEDELVVSSGERVPIDGTVIEGSAAVDQSLVTGESLPVPVESGDDVIGGAIVTDGRLILSPSPDGTSTIDRLLSALWEVSSTQPGVQRLVDRLAAIFVPLVVVLAVSATIIHLFLGAPPATALLTGLAVLVVSCPCALGLATPLAIAAGVRDALTSGFVVSSGDVFERAVAADVIALDKTGTLTTGEMAVVEVHGETAGLARAAAIEEHADHPVADAIVEYAETIKRTFPDGGTAVESTHQPTETAPGLMIEEYERHPGRGVSALVDGERVLVGSPTLFEVEGWKVPAFFAAHCDRARNEGLIPTLVGWDGTAKTVVLAGDQPRDGWESVVDALSANRTVVVISGDSPEATARFEAHPGIEQVFAGVPPEAKSEVVSRLRREDTVAMVGDGSNDAPALAAADVGIAMGGGTALATDAADVVVLTDEFAAVPKVFGLTAATKRRIHENLCWAFLYNALAIPAAVLGLLNPLVAAVAMATSSILVVANTSRPVIDDD